MLIMAAAVADYRPAEMATQKIKKGQPVLDLHLERTIDILGSLAERQDLLRIGFAAETEHLVEAARDKVQRKKLDLIVANDAVATIGAEETEITLIDRQGEARTLPRMHKAKAAQALIESLLELFPERLSARRSTSEDHQTQ